MKLKNLLYIFLILVVFTACKTTKSASKDIQTSTPALDTLHNLTPAEMVQKLQKNQPAFSRANANKMSVYIDFQGRQLDVKASCKIVSDSALHLSIQPFFGVELFKVEMTPESMIVIDKANRRFYESNYGIFKSRLGIHVNYDAVQSLLSNRLFVAGKKGFLPDDFSWKNDTRNTLYVQAETMNQEVVVDFVLARIAEMILKTNDNKYTMKTTYADFKNFGGTVFPEKIFIDGMEGNKKASFHFTIEEMRFDVPFAMESTNLTRYTRGDINAFFAK